MMEYNLFLDDLRSPKSCATYMPNKAYYLDNEFVVVRSYNEFVDTLINKQLNGYFPSSISFDHDLGSDEENHDAVITNDNKDGYDCAKWLADFCLQKNIKLPKIYVHSMNPVGAKNIIFFLSNFKKFQNG